MKSLKPYPGGPELLTESIRLVAAEPPAEELVRALRQGGFDKPNSTKFFCEFAGYRLGEAFDLIHFSATWADRFPADDVFQRSVEDAFDALADEERTAA